MYPTDLTALIDSFWNNKRLIFSLARREVAGRYRGSMLGVIWAFIQPIVMLAVYTFVFSVVFHARWGDSGGGRVEFAVVLFCGLIVYNIFSECINRAPGLVVSSAMYVKKIIFPVEILPWVSLVASLFHALTSLVVLLVFCIAVQVPISWSALLFPVVLFPMLLIVLGLSWLLASLGVFLRDTGQIVGIITTVLLFLTPIFYPIAAVPGGMQQIISLNPLAVIIEQFRRVFLWGYLPDLLPLAFCYVAGILIAWLGFAWFQRTRKGFADVL